MHNSPNNAQPNSYIYDAEEYWLQLGFTPIPTPEHEHIYQAMLDQFGDSEECDF